MEISSVFIALGCLLALSIISKVIKGQYPERKLPPGPRPWPIIGNLNLVGSLPHESLHHLSKKYGALMFLKFGSKPVLVASSPEMAKEFLKTHDASFASRPALSAGKYTSYNYSNMAWAPYGSFWRQARKIYLSEIFDPKRLESFKYIRVGETRTLTSCLHTLSRKPVFLKDHLPQFTLCTMSRMVMSGKYYNDESKSNTSIVSLEKLQWMLDELFLLNGVINLRDWVPLLSWFDSQGYVKLENEGIGKEFCRISQLSA